MLVSVTLKLASMIKSGERSTGRKDRKRININDRLDQCLSIGQCSDNYLSTYQPSTERTINAKVSCQKFCYNGVFKPTHYLGRLSMRASTVLLVLL